MNRALRAAAMGGVLLVTPVALSACSAGQVAQTAQQKFDRLGGSANVGPIAIRNAALAYPVGGVYAAGSDARLIVAIANTGQTDDTLVSITSTAFTSAKATGTTAPATGTTAPAGGLNVPVPAGATVYVGGNGPAITVTGLTQSFAVGQVLEATMTFAKAGAASVRVLVSVPPLDLPRGTPYNFHAQG